VYNFRNNNSVIIITISHSVNICPAFVTKMILSSSFPSSLSLLILQPSLAYTRGGGYVFLTRSGEEEPSLPRHNMPEVTCVYSINYINLLLFVLLSK